MRYYLDGQFTFTTENLSNNMKYGYRKNYFLLSLLLFLSACSPQRRLLCLLENHPYLIDSLRHDTIQIQQAQETDTQFLWKTERDTIFFNNIRLERFRDTIRLFTRERACTTYIHTTELRPSKVVEKYISEKTEEGLKGKIYQGLIYLLIGAFVTLILFRR